VKNAVERTVPFGMLIQSMVTVWYTLHGHHPDDVLARRLAEPWYQTKTEPSFEDMITKLRKTLIVARFSPVRTGRGCRINRDLRMSREDVDPIRDRYLIAC
jgi:hypothetical protein